MVTGFGLKIANSLSLFADIYCLHSCSKKGQSMYTLYWDMNIERWIAKDKFGAALYVRYPIITNMKSIMDKLGLEFTVDVESANVAYRQEKERSCYDFRLVR